MTTVLRSVRNAFASFVRWLTAPLPTPPPKETVLKFQEISNPSLLQEIVLEPPLEMSEDPNRDRRVVSAEIRGNILRIVNNGQYNIARITTLLEEDRDHRWHFRKATIAYLPDQGSGNQVRVGYLGGYGDNLRERVAATRGLHERLFGVDDSESYNGALVYFPA